MTSDALQELQQRLKRFATERDWEQFHSPKNLAMALMVEASELAEHFQWLTQKQSHDITAEKLEEVSLETADIFIYLLRITEQLNVDLLAAVERKIAINEQRYPADKVRGSSRKYNEY